MNLSRIHHDRKYFPRYMGLAVILDAYSLSFDNPGGNEYFTDTCT
jgi:hypothetical protein